MCYANGANLFICYIYLKYILRKLRSSETRGVHSNIEKHQVVRDLKKFENHWHRGLKHYLSYCLENDSFKTA